jgi:hypothetical protein
MTLKLAIGILAIATMAVPDIAVAQDTTDDAPKNCGRMPAKKSR